MVMVRGSETPSRMTSLTTLAFLLFVPWVSGAVIGRGNGSAVGDNAILFSEKGTKNIALRVGAVFETSSRESAAIRAGYDLFIRMVSESNSNLGMPIFWRDGSKSHFKFESDWREAATDEEHAREVTNMLKESPKIPKFGKIDFLLGSHGARVGIETRLAAGNRKISMQCCENSHLNHSKYLFSVQPPSRKIPELAVRRMALKKYKLGVISHGKENLTTCQGVLDVLSEFKEVEGTSAGEPINRLVKWATYNPENRKESVRDFVREVIDLEVDAVVGCMPEGDGEVLARTFHRERYALKSFFLTHGPSNPAWTAHLGNPDWIQHILSATVWHPKVKKHRDPFFGASADFQRLLNNSDDPFAPLSAAAAASLYVLSRSIQNAFRDCKVKRNVLEGGGALGFTDWWVACEDGQRWSVTNRVIHALNGISLDTFFGRVKFGGTGLNVGLTPLTTQIKKLKSGAMHILPVLPVEFALDEIEVPKTNPYKRDCIPGEFIAHSDFKHPCRKCPPGQFSEKNNTSYCERCMVGQWMNQTGATVCHECPNGSTTRQGGGVAESECVCMAGFYSVGGLSGVECVECPEGAICEGAGKLPEPQKGFWGDRVNRERVYECDPTEVCLGGPKSSCKEGHQGRLCADCIPGYFQINGQCSKCLHQALIILIILSLIAVWYILNVVISRNVASLDMLLGFAQLANIIGDVGLNWPNSMKMVFLFTNILDFDVDILEPSCLGQWSFGHNLVVQLLLPILMGSMALMGFVIAWMLLVCTERWGNGISRGWWSKCLRWFVSIPKNRRKLAEKWDSTIAAYLSAIEVTYITVTKYCFDVFKCRDVSGVQVLSASPDIQCYSKQHTTYIILATLGILFYAIGYVALITCKFMLMKKNRTFSSPRNLRRYGFLYRRFEPSYFWMSAVISLRRMVFVIVLVFMGNPAFQAGTMAIIIVASLMLVTYTAPYVDTYLDVLFSFLLVALMFETFGGIMFYGEKMQERDRAFLEWIVLFATFLLGLVFLVIFSLEVIRKYQVHVLEKVYRKQCTKGRSRNSVSDIESHTQRNLKLKERVSTELFQTFNPGFLFKALVGCPQNVEDWDRLTDMLKAHMSDQSSTSYLSMENVAKFWRKLVLNFPELVDFLMITDEETRMHFAKFSRALYLDYYLSKKVEPLQVYRVLNWRDRAPLAHWLAVCSREEREFFAGYMTRLFESAKGKEAGEQLFIRVTSRGKSTHGTLSQSCSTSIESTEIKKACEARRNTIQTTPTTSNFKCLPLTGSWKSAKLKTTVRELLMLTSHREDSIHKEREKGHGPFLRSTGKKLSGILSRSKGFVKGRCGELDLSGLVTPSVSDADSESDRLKNGPCGLEGAGSDATVVVLMEENEGVGPDREKSESDDDAHSIIMKCGTRGVEEKLHKNPGPF